MLENIKNVVTNSISIIVDYRFLFIRALVIPALITSIGIAFMSESSSVAIVIIKHVIEWLVYTMLAITTHRIILLGPESASNWGIYIPKGREFNFIFHEILIGLCLMPLLIFGMVPGFGQFIIIAMAIYFIARWSLVFPSIATDNPLTMTESWNTTDSHQATMIFVIAIFPFVTHAYEFLAFLVDDAFSISFLLIMNFLSLIALIFTVAALSESYRLISNQANV